MAGGGSSFSSQLPQTHGSLEPQPPVLSASESQGFRWRSCSRWQWLQTSSPRLPKAEPRPPGPKRPRIASEQKRPDRRRGTGTYKSPRGFRQAGEESDPGEQTWRRQLREAKIPMDGGRGFIGTRAAVPTLSFFKSQHRGKLLQEA